MKKVAVIMGSKSDWEIMSDACNVLDDFSVEYHKEVVSAHRTPEKMFEFAKKARENGFGAIIAGAGGAAHLPGMVASITNLPVIGVPIMLKSLEGMDSLLSIVQMPKGVPVATVAINNSTNAGLLAVEMLGIENSELANKLIEYKDNMKRIIEEEHKLD